MTLARILLVFGFILLTIASVLAFDQYMTPERKAEVQDQLVTNLDENAETFAQNRQKGCRGRGCGFFPRLASWITGLRDGVFQQIPFEPDAVLPPAPAGWQSASYDLGVVEKIVGVSMERTALSTTTQNSLLMSFDDDATAADAGGARLYWQEGKAIAITLFVSRDALRDAKDGENAAAEPVESAIATLDGLPIRDHPQQARDFVRNTLTDVAYRHLSMDLDGQVRVTILALAEDEDLLALLAGFQLAPIINTLPAAPVGYRAGAGLVIPEPELEPDVANEEAGQRPDDATETGTAAPASP